MAIIAQGVIECERSIGRIGTLLIVTVCSGQCWILLIAPGEIEESNAAPHCNE